jgi:hypothetical protein
MEKRGSIAIDGKKPERGKHPDHEEIPVGKIDDIHNPPDKGEANRHKGIHKTNHQTVDDLLKQLLRHDLDPSNKRVDRRSLIQSLPVNSL